MILGSAELIHALLPAGLIDAMLLTIHPLVLGSGKRLYPDAVARFRLVESKPTTTGVLITRYERAGSDACLALQRLARRRADLDVDELARRGQPAEVHDLVVARAPAQARGVVARRALDQHLERPPHEALGALARPPLDHLDEALHALDAQLVREELVGEGGRLGAPPRRVDEREGAVEADLLGDRERLLEVGLGLAREADDDVGGDRAVRDVLADQRHAVEEALARVGAAHPLQHRRGARLQRQVDVLAHARQLGVGADDVLLHVGGVRARVADAVEALDAVERVQQLGERRPRPQRPRRRS